MFIKLWEFHTKVQMFKLWEFHTKLQVFKLWEFQTKVQTFRHWDGPDLPVPGDGHEGEDADGDGEVRHRVVHHAVSLAKVPVSEREGGRLMVIMEERAKKEIASSNVVVITQPTLPA